MFSKQGEVIVDSCGSEFTRKDIEEQIARLYLQIDADPSDEGVKAEKEIYVTALALFTE